MADEINDESRAAINRQAAYVGPHWRYIRRGVGAAVLGMVSAFSMVSCNQNQEKAPTRFDQNSTSATQLGQVWGIAALGSGLIAAWLAALAARQKSRRDKVADPAAPFLGAITLKVLEKTTFEQRAQIVKDNTPSISLEDAQARLKNYEDRIVPILHQEAEAREEGARRRQRDHDERHIPAYPPRKEL